MDYVISELASKLHDQIIKLLIATGQYAGNKYFIIICAVMCNNWKNLFPLGLS